MNRRWLPLGALGALAGIALLAIGCGGAYTPPAATSAPAKQAESTKPAAEATKPAAQAAPTIQLKLSHHEPETSLFHAALVKWSNEINQKTNGQVKITIYPGETLAKGREITTAVESGMADIGWAIVGFFPGQFPLTEAGQMPILGINNSVQGSKALWDLYSGNPDVQKEWSKYKLIGFTSSGTQWISTSKKPVRVIEDVKGLKLRVSGWGGTELMKNLGASPMNVAPPEMYESISKGILDGAVFDWQGINSNRLYEVLNYASTFPIIIQPQALIMNQNKWKSLPPDVQKVFDEVGGKYYGQLVGGQAFDAADAQGIDNFKKLNKEIITFPPDQVKKWQDAAKPVWAAWVESVKPKGLDGQKALDQLLAAIEKNK